MIDENDPNDRFGFTEQQILDALNEHAGLIRDGCYVPTRHEVATWPADRLWWHLLGWWDESPITLIPNDEQIAASVDVLLARPDADSEAIQRIVVQAPLSEAWKAKRRQKGGSNDEQEGGG